MTEVFNEFISPGVRRGLYAAFALVGVGFGATQTAYVTAGTEAPMWLAVAFQVYLYIGGAFGLVAATNTVKPTATLSGIETDEVVIDEAIIEDISEDDFEEGEGEDVLAEEAQDYVPEDPDLS